MEAEFRAVTMLSKSAFVSFILSSDRCVGPVVMLKRAAFFSLPHYPTEQLWRYYSTLGCITLLEKKKLWYWSLLDNVSTFEIYKVINLPMPYPKPNQKFETVARYKVAAEFLPLNLARTKFVLVTSEEANRCKLDALGIYLCICKSSLCVKGIEKKC